MQNEAGSYFVAVKGKRESEVKVLVAAIIYFCISFFLLFMFCPIYHYIRQAFSSLDISHLFRNFIAVSIFFPLFCSPVGDVFFIIFCLINILVCVTLSRHFFILFSSIFCFLSCFSYTFKASTFSFSLVYFFYMSYLS